jgi:hypothetical protein
MTFVQDRGLDIVKDALLSHETFNMTHVLHEHLHESNSKLYGQTVSFYRINEYFSRPVYL